MLFLFAGVFGAEWEILLEFSEREAEAESRDIHLRESMVVCPTWSECSLSSSNVLWKMMIVAVPRRSECWSEWLDALTILGSTNGWSADGGLVCNRELRRNEGAVRFRQTRDHREYWLISERRREIEWICVLRTSCGSTHRAIMTRCTHCDNTGKNNNDCLIHTIRLCPSSSNAHSHISATRKMGGWHV